MRRLLLLAAAVGACVALCGDLLVVGGSGKDSVNPDAGQVYASWTEQQSFIPKTIGPHEGHQMQPAVDANDGSPSDDFGFAVSVSGDAILVGAAQDTSYGSGEAHVFRDDSIGRSSRRATARPAIGSAGRCRFATSAP